MRIATHWPTFRRYVSSAVATARWNRVHKHDPAAEYMSKDDWSLVVGYHVHRLTRLLRRILTTNCYQAKDHGPLPAIMGSGLEADDDIAAKARPHPPYQNHNTGSGLNKGAGLASLYAGTPCRLHSLHNLRPG